jgi:hypothetical protein
MLRTHEGNTKAIVPVSRNENASVPGYTASGNIDKSQVPGTADRHGEAPRLPIFRLLR